MGRIELNGMRFHAFHGCCESEKLLGNLFTVDIWCDYDSSSAERSDFIEDAVDYSVIYNIVKREMDIRSNLIENLCYRILNGIKNTLPGISHCGVKVYKMNPPLAGTVCSSSFYIEY